VHVLLFGNCITAACSARRDNARYDAPAGRKKVLLLAQYMAALGHTVEIVSPSYAKKRDDEWREEIRPGLTVRHAPTFAVAGVAPRRQQRAADYFCKMVQAHAGRPDVLVVSYNYHEEYAAALLAAHAAGMKTLLELEDGLYLDDEWKSPARRALERSAYASASGCLVVNAGLAERVREVLGKAVPHLVVPGLPDLCQLGEPCEDEQPGDRRLLFAGNFGREQGFGQLRQWIEHLPDEMELDLTGSAGPEEVQELQQLISRRHNIRYHGFVTEGKLAELREAADACLLLHNPASPYHRTQFPSKFFDYLSANKRVVSAADARLELFRGLPHLFIVENFPAGLTALRERLQKTRPPSPDAILQLGESLRRNLGEFMKTI